MPSSPRHLTLKFGAFAGLAFLLMPLLVVALYAFTTDQVAFTFPPPGLTTRWFGQLFEQRDFWNAFGLSLRVAAVATSIALVLGTLISLGLYRTSFFGRDAISLLVILPIALPGIVTGISLRSAMSLANLRDFGFWTIVVGHATFCIVTVFNNVVARLRRTAHSQIEASLDLGASPFQTFRYVLLPNIATALLAGGMLAFALSFDEVIVTTFTAGQQRTLPIWIYDKIARPTGADRPVTNVAALIVMAITFIPIIIAHYVTRETSD